MILNKIYKYSSFYSYFNKYNITIIIVHYPKII